MTGIRTQDRGIMKRERYHYAMRSPAFYINFDLTWLGYYHLFSPISGLIFSNEGLMEQTTDHDHQFSVHLLRRPKSFETRIFVLNLRDIIEPMVEFFLVLYKLGLVT